MASPHIRRYFATVAPAMPPPMTITRAFGLAGGASVVELVVPVDVAPRSSVPPAAASVATPSLPPPHAASAAPAATARPPRTKFRLSMVMFLGSAPAGEVLRD